MISKLEIDSVILKFNEKVILQDVYLKNEVGNITGLLGRNGAGKTCLMNIVYGVMHPNDCSVRINGQVLQKSFRPPEQIRYLPQFNFIPKNLKLKRIFNDFELDFMDFINEFPEFEKYYELRLSKLSSGEQRIVEIFAILVSNTKFVMLDEPFSQVMPIHIETIKSLILREKEKKGIIITDHLYDHIIDISDSLYVIKDGKTHLTHSLTDIEKLGYIKCEDK